MKRGLQYLIPLLLSGLATLLLSGVLFSTRADAQAPGNDLEVIIAIDTSGSMRSAIGAAKQAANEFVASMPADVRIGVETFGDSVNVLTPPTTDRALLTEQINGIRTGGDTALYDVVVAASQHFTPTVEHKVLVLLSDGKDEGSTATLDEAVAAVQSVHVEAISLTTAQTDLQSLSALGPVTSADDATGVSTRVQPSGWTGRRSSRTGHRAHHGRSGDHRGSGDHGVALHHGSDDGHDGSGHGGHRPSGGGRRHHPGATCFVVSAVDRCRWRVLRSVAPRRAALPAPAGLEDPARDRPAAQHVRDGQARRLRRRGGPRTARHRVELATALTVAGISMKPAEFVATVAVVAIIAGLVGLFMGGPLLGVIVALAVCFMVRFYVRRTKAKRQAAFADHLPDVLQLVTTALRSGFGLTQALDSVAEEADEPARSDLLTCWSRRASAVTSPNRCEPWHAVWRATTWSGSSRPSTSTASTGGNLSEILATVSATIRERQRMGRQVRTLTRRAGCLPES